MKSVFLRSPAKLNLYLKVINKREDNFHNIETVFERINLFDEILYTELKENKIKIITDNKDIPTGPKNLIFKVVKRIKDDFKIDKGVLIKIKKRIPVAAGLAGGSSNAATTLLALNKLWNLRLNREKLTHYAREIGSDVAFFLYDSSWALGVERGDKIKPLNIKTKLWHILVVPRFRVYAKDIYRALNLGLTKNAYNASIFIRNLKKSNYLYINGSLLNDLEVPIIRLYARLKGIKQRLKLLGIKGVMISGSGPGVFGIVGSESQAKSIKKILDKVYSQVYVVKTY